MKTYAGVFLLSLLLAAVLTPGVRRLALRLGAVDRPGRRKVHRREVARLGGIAIYASFFLPLLSFLFIANTVSDLVEGRWPEILGLLVGSTIILVVGVMDDLRGWSPWLKLPLEVLAAAVVCWMGIRITLVTNPFGAPIDLGVAGPVVTVIWIVGIANAINLLDGIDGLAAGVTAFAAIAISICALSLGNVVSAVLLIGLAGAILGFLHHNFHPARIFMGDSGSLFVGFTLASLAILGSLKSSTVVAIAIPILILGLPIADTLLAAGRRFFLGRPLFRADDEHVHHTLLRSGFTQRQSSLILYTVTLFLGAAAILLTYNNTRGIGVGFLLTGIFGVILFRRVVLARGRRWSGPKSPESLREARRCLFRVEEALRAAGREEEVWDAIRSAVADLGYERARWAVELPGVEKMERSWGMESEDGAEWDLRLSLSLGRGTGVLLANRPGGSSLDFETRDAILALLSDLAAERMLSTLPRPGAAAAAPEGRGAARR